MSTDKVTVRFNGDVKHRFQDYLEETGGSAAAAARTLIDDGLRARGYHPAEQQPASYLRQFTARLAHGFAIAGLILTGMSITGNPGVQVYTIAVFLTAIVLEATNRAAASHIDELAARIRDGVLDA